VNPEQRKEWRFRSKSERERLTMERLLRGDVIHGDVRASVARDDPVLSNNTPRMLSDWMKDGLVSGFVPLLSPKGREYFAGLQNIQDALPREAIGGPASVSGTCPFCGEPEPHEKKVRCIIQTVKETTVGAPAPPVEPSL
jgi:hypothetical protein